MPKTNRPDAVKFPFPTEHLEYRRRAHAALDVAEAVLAPDKPNGERAYVRRNRDGYFATRDPKDGEFYPSGHLRWGEARYRWEPVDGKPGVLAGRLKADDEKEADVA